MTTTEITKAAREIAKNYMPHFPEGYNFGLLPDEEGYDEKIIMAAARLQEVSDSLAAAIVQLVERAQRESSKHIRLTMGALMEAKELREGSQLAKLVADVIEYNDRIFDNALPQPSESEQEGE